MKPVARPISTAVLTGLALTLALLCFGTAPAGATKVFDGKSFTTKPATITGLKDGYRGKGPITNADLLIGGPDATPGDYGHINWVKWTRTTAVGFGTAWHLGSLNYDSEVGANPWNGSKVRVALRSKKGQFNRLGVMQRASWRTASEQGKCDYFLGFVYKPFRHLAHPWMQVGIGGGWPSSKQPCMGIKVS